MDSTKPIEAMNVAKASPNSLYPEPFASMMNGRAKRKLGDHFGLSNFGINLTELQPGAMSALKHHHVTQDEFIYIVSGEPTLSYGDEEFVMKPGECFGFKKDGGVGHHLVNKSHGLVVYLEIGDRSPGDHVEYPDNDLRAEMENNGSWLFLHANGSPY